MTIDLQRISFKCSIYRGSARHLLHYIAHILCRSEFLVEFAPSSNRTIHSDLQILLSLFFHSNFLIHHLFSKFLLNNSSRLFKRLWPRDFFGEFHAMPSENSTRFLRWIPRDSFGEFYAMLSVNSSPFRRWIPREALCEFHAMPSATSLTRHLWIYLLIAGVLL